MTFFFRTSRFDTTSGISEDSFRGEDVASWLCAALAGWKTNVDPEDWGWAVSAIRGDHAYIFGIYDHDTSDEAEQGARWCLRLHNQRSPDVPFYKKLFRNIPPVAAPEIVAEIEAILKQQTDFHDIQNEEQG